MTRISFLVLLSCLFVGAGLLAAADQPIAGDWDCIATTPDGGEVALVLSVKEQDGKLAGALSMDGRDHDLIEPKFEADVFTFRILLESGSYEVQLKVSGKKLEGSWKGGGIAGQMRGSKKT